MKERKKYFADNDAIFHSFFKNNINLFFPLIKRIFKIELSDIKKINLLNKFPYLDDVYNKYNVLYLQIRLSDKYLYLIINNINTSKCTKYSENYILNIELSNKYKCFYEKNKGQIKSVYFIYSKDDWVERIMVWKNDSYIINTDIKHIFNLKNKSNYIVKDISKILNIISIRNEYNFNRQNIKFKNEYNRIMNSIDENSLKEAIIFKNLRNKFILESIKNN